MCHLFDRVDRGHLLILLCGHYGDFIMGTISSQTTSLMIVYSTVYSDADERKHQSSTSLAFVRGIHQGPVNSPHKWPVRPKMFPFDDVIMDPEGAVTMMILWHGNAFCITVILWGEPNNDHGFPSQGASNAELWSKPQQAVEQTVELSMIWDALMVMWHYSNAMVICNMNYEDH